MNIKDEVLKLGEELISDPIKNANHAAKLLRRIDSSEVSLLPLNPCTLSRKETWPSQ